MAAELRELTVSLARLMGETVDGAPDQNFGGAEFGVSALESYEDDYYNDWFGRFIDGPSMGLNWDCTDFTKANGVITHTPAVKAANAPVSAADRFFMTIDTKTQDIVDAINLAISAVEDEALTDIEDTSLFTVASTWEYPAPPDFAWIEELYLEQDAANRYSQSGDLIDYRHWSILRGATPRVWFDPNYVTLTTGRKIRLIGQGKAAQLETDDAVTHMSPMYLMQQGKALLHQGKIGTEAVGERSHKSQMEMAQGRADIERRKLLVAGRGRKVRFG